MNERIRKVIAALEGNNMNAVWAENKEDILNTVKNLLPKESVVSSGGSQTLVESGVLKLIKGGDYNYLDRFNCNDPMDVYRGVVGCDYYFCSSNALTEKGELINVDGFANRISAISFGPKKVIVIVGKNKIVKDAREGFLRVKKIAAPKNCVRLSCDTPCAKLGHCVSLLNNENPDITDGCASPSRICRSYLITGRQKDENRITVIISGENLGY
ncbi:MAG: lactate utilization protein [Clostridia bacterium]|nr:lactate utilization protein [Clostridia bacterium]